MGALGGESWTVAFGRETVLPSAEAPGRAVRAAGVVAGPVFSGMVGAGFGTPAAGAVLRGMVAAGAGRGAPPTAGAVGAGGAVRTVGAGGAVGVGGRTAGAVDAPAPGEAGGASAAFRVTRTVSFFSGMLEVCFDGVGSFSLIRSRGFGSCKT